MTDEVVDNATDIKPAWVRTKTCVFSSNRSSSVYPGLIRLSSGHFFLLSDLEQSLIKKPEKHVLSTPVDPSCGVYEWRSSRLILIPFYVSISCTCILTVISCILCTIILMFLFFINIEKLLAAASFVSSFLRLLY